MLRVILLLIALLLPLSAQDTASWKRAFPAHKIAGNLYYVGTEDLACFLIVTPEGHILINTGLADSTPLIRDSFRQLGFRMEDVKILLTMQAHFDHVAAMSEIKKISGAKVFATEADAPILEDGGKSDPYFGKSGWFEPVKVDRRLKHGDVVELGGVKLTVVCTPGHSKGSVSYTMEVDDAGHRRSVALANMGSVVMPLVGNTKYPNIAGDFVLSFDRQKKLKPEIWVASHASQYRMAEKIKTGSFIDPDGYKQTVRRMERQFQEQWSKEKRETSSR